MDVKNSKITSNGKGMYIQKGRKVYITNNEVTGNDEEGLDLRDKISGRISGNYIGGNSEGGIEIILGSSDVAIEDNTIKKNSASGIAAQFYSSASKTGEVKIAKNNISYNGSYGLTCKNPSGGDSSSDYYNKSLELRNNKKEHNKSKAISGSCNIMKAISKEEEKAYAITESATASGRSTRAAPCTEFPQRGAGPPGR